MTNEEEYGVFEGNAAQAELSALCWACGPVRPK